jgi:hypothetical protein
MGLYGCCGELGMAIKVKVQGAFQALDVSGLLIRKCQTGLLFHLPSRSVEGFLSLFGMTFGERPDTTMSPFYQ